MGLKAKDIPSPSVNIYHLQVVLSIAAAIVAFTSITIGARYKLENSTKLYALTFMLVSFGSENLQSKKGALALTLTRISGICFGVVLSGLSSVLIFPKSATEEALVFLRKALRNLTELNAMAWQHGPLFRPDWKNLMPLKGTIDWSSYHYDDENTPWQDLHAREAKFEEECENLLMDTYTQLNKVSDSLSPAKSEVYIGHLRQKLCFLPGIPWLQIGRAVLPSSEVQEMATTIRRVARLLWAIHLSFQEGFDQNMLEMLKQQYPEDLMPSLAQQTQGCLQDAFDAFPNQAEVETKHLMRFVTAVESLLRISDYQRRRVLHHMKRQKMGSRARSVTARSLGGASPGSPQTSVTASLLGHSYTSGAQSPGREYQFSRNKSKRLDAMESRNGREGKTVEQNEEGGLRKPLLSSSDQASNGEEQSAAGRGSYDPPAQQAEQRDRDGHASTAATSYAGNPEEVFRNLPNHLHISIDEDTNSQSQGDQEEFTLNMDVDEDASSISIQLRNVPSSDLLVFPETAEGYVDKVRWYSFQFLMEELAEEVEYMHEVLNRLLQKLPRPCLKL